MIIKQKHNKGHQVIVNKDVQAMYLVGLGREGVLKTQILEVK